MGPTNVGALEEAYPSPGEAAFAQAWERAWAGRNTTPNEQFRNVYVLAWQAYDEVQRGVFVDEDMEAATIVARRRPGNPR